ncbi:MAG: hypothetical protein IT429_12760 [Gemmataceae bacterium]|nr:hypothetical protein [Gemmataceae bacterium]
MSSRRRILALVLVAVLASTGAAHRTTNFVVHAPTPQIAQQVGQYAEHYRRQKAIEWLGHEMPTWPHPCPLHVQVVMEGPSGATSFIFQPGGGVSSMKMEIRGPLDRLLSSVLPHEVTHTVFAYYFRCPVPRWADEGGSVLSEDDVELERHDKLVRQILNRGQQFPLRRLMALKDYPAQHEKVVCLYAQGFSLAHYLVHISNKQTFLQFVAHGMSRGWDSAAHAHYGLRSVEELEQTWLKHLRETKGTTIVQLAQLKKQPKQQAVVQAEPTSRTVVQLTAPPAQPLTPTPIYRGVPPAEGQQGQRFGDTPRPGYLPDYPARPAQPTTPAPAQNWQPAPVRLQPPEPAPASPEVGQPFASPAVMGQPMPPPGFPRQ